MKKTLLLILILTMGLNAEILNEVRSLPADYKYTEADCNAYTEENLFVLETYVKTGGHDKKFVVDHTETTKYVCEKANAPQMVIDAISKTLNRLKGK